MAQTLAAVFDNRASAESARQKLIASGFGSERIRLNDAASDYSGAPSATSTVANTTGRDDDGFVASIKHFFADLFGSHEDRYVYAEAVSRGHVVLTLESASDAEIDRASDIVEDFGPLNIEEHSEQWRAGGWSRDDSTTGAYAGGSKGNLSGSAAANLQSQSGSLSQQTTPLGAGAELGINPAAPVGNLSGGTLDQPSTASQQFARDDSLNQPDFIAPGGATSLGGATRNVRTYPRADTLSNDVVADEQYYRSHWDATYLSTGARFEDYDPAYRYGRSMAGSDTYRGRPWEEVEHDLRSNWEHTYPQSAWDNFKDAVRHGWNRLTS
ncbi:hypothetical protein [Janthinobacterium sp. PC23-8]|uniref:hypothetical protein n=1 Tax=Janthinobacterium sp. PC23-8 TaxID=2012679 RepID=UPI000B9732E8|nr:hypothetical protein [Janthinobacterium sp. PC23-8]OYO31549.1 hypothetical protein CD932_10770 [Janthinobacterium sp. PC23-8]